MTGAAALSERLRRNRANVSARVNPASRSGRRLGLQRFGDLLQAQACPRGRAARPGMAGRAAQCVQDRGGQPLG